MLTRQDLLDKLKQIDEVTLIEVCELDSEKIVQILDNEGLIDDYWDELEGLVNDNEETE